MMCKLLLVTLLLLSFVTVSICRRRRRIVKRSEEHHHESEVEECAGGFWCVKPDYEAKCFDDSAEYCECMDGAGSTNVKYNTTTKSCQSDERTSCDEFRPNLRAFYQGVCYTKQQCEDDHKVEIQPWRWVDSDTQAKCAPLKYLCGTIEDSEYDAVKHTCNCTEEGAKFHGDHCHAEDTKVSMSAKWGYGIIAVAIISAMSVFGVFIVLFRHQWWYQLLLSTMVALAMGCLLSDATLHLIPLSLGLHSHDDGDSHGHDDSEEEEEKMTEAQRLNITIGITLGIYLFLIFEKLIQIVIPHGHSHGGEDTVVSNKAADTEMKAVNGEAKEDVIGARKGGICNVEAVAWMVIVGDAMHNFADGLVMGAAFTNSLATGLGTAIAVFCHEVPHELGDFAVLLNAGMKIKWAVLFNFLSACTCFLGLFVGLAIGEDDTAQKWIFAFTAGMFIYIACADLIPEMNRNCEDSKMPRACFALQQVGAFCGFLVMLLIAIYEHDLENLGGDSHHHH